MDIQDVSLYLARFNGDDPCLIVTAQVQYIFCVKDYQGNIVEGHPNDIRMENHMWLFQQDTTGETNDWEILDLSFGQAVRMNA